MTQVQAVYIQAKMLADAGKKNSTLYCGLLVKALCFSDHIC